MALNFPAKIYQILENESSDIIRWHPNGAAFRIVDHGRFEREIIPKYFRHNQLSSVQRQLNLYGFKCISRGEDKGAFYHSKFKRGDWEVVKKINRYAPLKKPELGEKGELLIGGVEAKADQLEGTSTAAQTTGAFLSTSSAKASFPGFSPNFHMFDPFGLHDVQVNSAFIPSSSESAAATAAMYSHPHSQWHWPAPHHPGFSYIPAMSMDYHHIRSDATNAQSSKGASTKPVDSVGSPSSSTNSSVVSSVEETKSAMSVQKEQTAPVVAPPAPSTKNNTLYSNQSQNQSYINIINDVVLIDPDFDLDTEFDFFQDVMPTIKEFSMKQPEPAVSPKAPVTSNHSSSSVSSNGSVRTAEIGVNTDISQANGLMGVYPIH